MSAGSVRVVSKRKGGLAAVAGEVVIDVDRTNPILGNRFVLRDHRDDDERAQVIAAYERELDADIASRGPKSMELDRLAATVRGGARLALRCWCAPRRCHADRLALIVAERAGVHIVGDGKLSLSRQAQLL